MTTQNIYTDNTYQSGSDENVLSVCNSVARSLYGTDAAESGVNPSKSHIIDILNEEQRAVSGLKDWLFLNASTTVNGYTTATTTTDTTSGTVSTPSSVFRSGAYTGTQYVAEKITVSSTYAYKPYSITMKMKNSGTGAGLVNATLTAYICPDSGGSPDITNYVNSASVVITNGVTDTSVDITATGGANVTFTFATVTNVLGLSTAYWVVIKTVFGATNGDDIDFCKTTATASTTTKTYWSNQSGWTAVTGERLYAMLTAYYLTYTNELTMAVDVDKIYRIYSGTSNTPSCNMREYSISKYMKDPSNMPTDYFTVQRLSSGAKVVRIKPSVEHVNTWTIEYKKVPTTVTGDTDIFDIPRGYTGILKIRAIRFFLALGYGSQDTGLIQLIDKQEAELMLGLKRDFLFHPSIAFVGVRGGGTPSGEAYTEPNRWIVGDGVSRPPATEKYTR